MNRYIRAAITPFLLLLLIGSVQAQVSVTISDRVGKNQATWTSEAPLETIKGTAEGAAGTVNLNMSNLSAMSGSVSFATATMYSGNSMRDEHMRGSNWLDATKYPRITFAISSATNIKSSGNTASGTAVGRFTLHGVTKNVSAPFTLKYVPANAATAKRAPGDLVMINASFRLALADFNIAGTTGTIGSKVGQTIDVNVSLYGSTGL